MVGPSQGAADRPSARKAQSSCAHSEAFSISEESD